MFANAEAWSEIARGSILAATIHTQQNQKANTPMANVAMTRLIAALDSDAGLKSKILAARTPEEATRIAVESGYDVTLDELISLAEPTELSSDAEMSDAELAGVSGGVKLPVKGALKGIGIRKAPSLPGLGDNFAADCTITACSGTSYTGCAPGRTDG